MTIFQQARDDEVRQNYHRSKDATTLIDVAKMADVAVGMVSRFLNGQFVSAAKRDRIEPAITELGYRRNMTGVAKKAGMTQFVGFHRLAGLPVFACQKTFPSSASTTAQLSVCLLQGSPTVGQPIEKIAQAIADAVAARLAGYTAPQEFRQARPA